MSKTNPSGRTLLQKVVIAVKEDGPIGLIIRPLKKIKHTYFTPRARIFSMVNKDDLYHVDWVDSPYRPKQVKKKTSYDVAWVMSPPGATSGGHQNIFRFMRYMEEAGHKCTIYLYSTLLSTPVPTILTDIEKTFPKLRAEMRWITNGLDIPKEHDAVFATGWETAYPVFRADIPRKFYFVQDFEPYFYPVGSESTLAENTYSFGFHGITAGEWLAKKLHDDYGMSTDSFDFSANTKHYVRTNDGYRKDVFFYARPVTARRAFELGVETLEVFSNQNPDSVIHLAGWDVSNYKLPFQYVNHAAMNPKDLPELYNKCSAALVLSLTNMSLLPLELLSCGTIPVVNDAPNNRLVSNNPFIKYAAPSPVTLANAMSEVVNAKDQTQNSRKAAMSLEGADWSKSGEQFIKAFVKGMQQ